ncbi:MAG: type II toxin-antitoxin system death-on-curing family toxin [Gemmatimonadaceae bacterium]|nr:type II toxin-antitoxin system death-on-curing family toxin [Gemmatimonadaceae bacterium]
MRPEPRWLTDATVLAIHAQQIERFGGAHGVRDPHLVLSGLARPTQRWFDDASADLADRAAVYLVGLSQAHGFVDGNKRTGLACALVFLAINDAALHVDGAELYALTMRVAMNQADVSDASAHVRAHLR